jgi:hypothetical protein
MISGIVVAAWPTLCSVSASSAIDPDTATMRICSAAVVAIPAKPIQAARIPSLLASSADWIASMES